MQIISFSTFDVIEKKISQENKTQKIIHLVWENKRQKKLSKVCVCVHACVCACEITFDQILCFLPINRQHLSYISLYIHLIVFLNKKPKAKQKSCLST